LILYALPDSLVRASSMSSVRLESYLFTMESFAGAKNALKPDGLLVLYNQYRWQWLVEKIAAMLEETFGIPPQRYTDDRTTIFVAGGPTPGQPPDRSVFEGVATDDWPFLYMQTPQVHWLYLGMIGMFLGVSLLGVLLLAPPGTLRRPNGAFFLMGAAFLLLETKSISFFSLLFGTTWLVNAMAFAGILVSVLVANLIVQYTHIRMRKVLFAGLFAALAIAYVSPASLLLGIESTLLRYLSAVVLVFSPIFLANLIFSAEFQDEEESTSAFGWNLLGTVLGGGLEYLSLLIGHSNLLWIVAACYAATALLLARRGSRPV
jgi:hypothetical protein